MTDGKRKRPMLAALRALADAHEAELRARFAYDNNGNAHPMMQVQFDRAMRVVRKARDAIDNIGGRRAV